MAKHQRFEATGLGAMRDYFDRDVDREIAETKGAFKAVVNAFTERVKANTPVGPPKRGKDSTYYEGYLRDSVAGHVNDSGSEIEGNISVGEGADYLWFVQADLAKQGKDFLRGADEAESLIERAVRGEALGD